MGFPVEPAKAIWIAIVIVIVKYVSRLPRWILHYPCNPRQAVLTKKNFLRWAIYTLSQTSVIFERCKRFKRVATAKPGGNKSRDTVRACSMLMSTGSRRAIHPIKSKLISFFFEFWTSRLGCRRAKAPAFLLVLPPLPSHRALARFTELCGSFIWAHDPDKH